MEFYIDAARTTPPPDVLQLVVPETLKRKAFTGLHDELGHHGFERTLDLARSRFFWLYMSKEIEIMIKSCRACALRKVPTPYRVAPLVNISSSAPMELVCMDFLKLERSKGGPENILVLTDHFTRYAQAIPTTNQTARTTAKALFEKFIVHYGFPERLHSDQGRNFESEVIRNLCELAAVAKTRTTPYHPSGNGMCERFNRTLLRMFGTLDDRSKANWKDYVAPLVHAYNTTKHSTTGYSPFYLMFGRHPRLAVDVYFGHQPNGRGSKGQSKFIKDLSNRLEYAYNLAKENMQAAQARQKKTYDRKPALNRIEVGDKVLLRNFTPSGKLDNAWEENVYVVTEKPNEGLPVYRIRREDKEGRVKTIHRNHLRLCPFRPSTDQAPPADLPSSVPRRSKRQRRKPSRFASPGGVRH